LRGILDQALDLAGRLGAALRQRAHLAGHHRKALALLAGARRFHRGVERQDVGLERDAVDHRDDFLDAAGAVGDATHAVHHFFHRLAAALREFGGAQRLAAGLVGVAGGELHGVGQLRQVGGGFLQRIGLAGAALGHVGPAGGDFASAGMDFLDPLPHRRHRGRQPGLHAAHGRVQHADFVVAAHGDGAGQVAVGDAVEMRAGLVQRAQDAAAKRQPDQHGQDQHGRQHAGGHRDHAFQRAAGLGHRGLALRPGVSLVGVGLLDVGRAAGRQHLVHQPVHLDPVPALDGRQRGRERLAGEGLVGGQHLVEQGLALLAGVRVGAQPAQAGDGLFQQFGGMRQRLVARLLQAAFHGSLGVGERGAGLEQPAGHVRQVAGPLDAAPAQRLDAGAVVAQHDDAGSRRHREQHHKQRKNGRQRRRDPDVFPHIRPSVTLPPAAAPAEIMGMQFGNFLTQPGLTPDKRPS